MFKYLHKERVVLSVSRFAAVSERRVLPVEVQSVEVVLPQKPHCVAHQFCSPVLVSDEWREASRALVPAADSEQRFQLLVVRLQPRELGVPTCACTHTHTHKITRIKLICPACQ